MKSKEIANEFSEINKNIDRLASESFENEKMTKDNSRRLDAIEGKIK